MESRLRLHFKLYLKVGQILLTAFLPAVCAALIFLFVDLKPLTPDAAVIQLTEKDQTLNEFKEIERDEFLAAFNPHQALKDPLDRIHPDFKVADNMLPRTQFWFDIYTKYGKNDFVIHHVRYPWIVFDVVNVDHFMNSKGALWMRRMRAESYAHQQEKRIEKALRSLARRRSYRNLNELESQLYKAIKPLSGSIKNNFGFAAKNIRSQLGQKDFFLAGLKRSGQYLPYIEDIFQKRGLPLELTRLPFVESSFNENAQSKVGASGIWQIMPATGKSFLTVNQWIDERNSPWKASEAAATLLKRYKAALKQWPLAITAYNHGIGNIKKSMRQAKSDDIGKIIERVYGGAFKFASSNFYAGFLAALHAEQYHNEIFPPHEIDKADVLHRITLRLPKSLTPSELVSLTGLSDEEFLKYNLDLKRIIQSDRHLPVGFRVFLPSRLEGQVTEQLKASESKVAQADTSAS